VDQEASLTIYPDDTDLILVAILPNPKDLDIARVFGWYRIPLKSAPKVISVDFLAFYQTGAFGEEFRWKINMIAPVKGHELTTRNSLIKNDSDHPRAKEEYYKIQIGQLIFLDKPIIADQWRRVTFFYTTGGLLKTASTIRDLVVTGEDRFVLWKNLRERMESSNLNGTVEQDFSDWNINFLKLLSDWEKIKDPENKYGEGYD